MEHSVDRIVDAFQNLTPAAVEQFDAIYAPRARFKDPFNDVQGVEEIQRIFRHMYESLDNPRFVVTGRIVQGNQCFLTWEFRFAFRRFKPGQAQCIVGGSHLVLGGWSHHAAPRLLGRGGGAVREAARRGRADALAEAAGAQLRRPLQP